VKPTGALREAIFGNASESRQRAESALALSTGRNVQYPVALAPASAGDTGRAKTLADDLDKRFPEDTWVQFNSAEHKRETSTLAVGTRRRLSILSMYA